MSTYVVTGAASFIGVPLCRRLLADDHRVIAVVRPHSPHNTRLPQDDKLCVVERDMHALSTLSDEVENADGLFHLMWNGIRGDARMDDTLQNDNAECCLEAVSQAIRLGCRVFVGSGSQAEYGKTDGVITEETPVAPQTAYGRAKVRCFQEGMALAQAAGMRFVWPRIFSLYGEGDYEHTLMMTVLRRLLAQEDVELTACTQPWDFLYIEDAVELLVRLAACPQAEGAYPVAGGYSQPLRTYIERVKAVLHTEGRLLFGARPYGAEGAVGFETSMEKTAAVLGSLPHTDFDSAVLRMAQGMII